MSIWYYDTKRPCENVRGLAGIETCIYCSTNLERDFDDESAVSIFDTLNYGFSDNFQTTATAKIGICPACGWWKYGVTTTFPRSVVGADNVSYRARCGSLRRFTLTKITAPIEDVRSYLTAKYEKRFSVHPRVFEEVVADVFRSLGYDAIATAYSGDGGVDVILRHASGETTGIQVKRYRNRIGVAQIRELTGALVLAGHTKGIFVTTSEFESGAEKTAEVSAFRGHPIELLDAPRFFDALKIAQLSRTREVLDRKPWGEVERWT